MRPTLTSQTLEVIKTARLKQHDSGMESRRIQAERSDGALRTSILLAQAPE